MFIGIAVFAFFAALFAGSYFLRGRVRMAHMSIGAFFVGMLMFPIGSALLALLPGDALSGPFGTVISMVPMFAMAVCIAGAITRNHRDRTAVDDSTPLTRYVQAAIKAFSAALVCVLGGMLIHLPTNTPLLSVIIGAAFLAIGGWGVFTGVWYMKRQYDMKPVKC